jgi:hypothetical protein
MYNDSHGTPEIQFSCSGEVMKHSKLGVQMPMIL